MRLFSANIEIERLSSGSGRASISRNEEAEHRADKPAGAPGASREQMSLRENWKVVLPAKATPEVLARALAWLLIRRHEEISTNFINDSIGITPEGALQLPGSVTDSKSMLVEDLTSAILSTSESRFLKVLAGTETEFYESDLGLPDGEMVQRAFNKHQTRDSETKSESAKKEDAATTSTRIQKKGGTTRK